MKKLLKIHVAGVVQAARLSRQSQRALTEIRDEIEQQLAVRHFFEGPQFKEISLILLLGIEDQPVPIYEQRKREVISLKVSIPLNYRGLQYGAIEEHRHRLEAAVLRTVIHIGIRYRLSVGKLALRLTELIGESEMEHLRADAIKKVRALSESTGDLSLEISFPTKSDSSGLALRNAVEAEIDGRLRDDGIGYCDGMQIGSGSAEIFCTVRDSAQALVLIKPVLVKHGVASQARILDAEGEQIWPSVVA